MEEELVSVLSQEEFKSKFGSDNLAVDSLLKGNSDHRDIRARPIISYRQYKELSNKGARLDGYMMRFVGPTGVGLVEASKFLKWWGQGFRPIEVAEQEKTKQSVDEAKAARDAPTAVSKDQVLIYPCNIKYPECPRFFDTPRARQTHWGIEHEKKLEKKMGKRRV